MNESFVFYGEQGIVVTTWEGDDRLILLFALTLSGMWLVSTHTAQVEVISARAELMRKF